WRNLFLLKSSLVPAFLPAKQTATVATTHAVSFHSTRFTCEKWKSKWNFDERSTRQPTKVCSFGALILVELFVPETKRALRNLLFNSDASTISFQDDDPIWKFDRTEGWDSDGSVKKWQSRFSGQHTRKSNHKKRRFRKIFSDDFDHPETMFQTVFGKKCYTWSFSGNFTFRSSESGFEWREKSDWTNQRTEEWEPSSESESVDESYAVGSCSDRAILGLPPTGHLKLEDVKKLPLISFKVAS
ncbi:hypothetical protein ERO13_D12G092200v2, partial [Gossypium hirsutum]